MLEIAVLCSAPKSILAGPVSYEARIADIGRHGHEVVPSEHVMLMQLLRMYHLTRYQCPPEQRTPWCRARCLDREALDDAAREVARLKDWLAEHPGLVVRYCSKQHVKPIVPALVRAFYSHLAIVHGHGARYDEWETVPHGEIVRIARSSLLFNFESEWMLYGSVKSCFGKSEMHIVSLVSPEWVVVCILCPLRTCRGSDLCENL